MVCIPKVVQHGSRNRIRKREPGATIAIAMGAEIPEGERGYLPNAPRHLICVNKCIQGALVPRFLHPCSPITAPSYSIVTGALQHKTTFYTDIKFSVQRGADCQTCTGHLSLPTCCRNGCLLAKLLTRNYKGSWLWHLGPERCVFSICHQ